MADCRRVLGGVRCCLALPTPGRYEVPERPSRLGRVYGYITSSAASFSARACGVEFYCNASWDRFLIYQSCGNIGGSTPQVPWNKVYAHDKWKGPTPP